MNQSRQPLTIKQQQDMEAAQHALASNDSASALRLLEPILKAGVVRADVYMLFATACRVAGHLAEARVSLNAAVNLDPENAAYWQALAELAGTTGDSNSERVALERVFALRPDSQQAALALADFLLRQADGDGAEPLLRGVIERDANSIPAQHGLALALRMQDRSSEALALTTQIVQQADAPVESEGLHGHLLGDLGRWEEAETTYRSLLARAPTHIDVQETFARMLPQLGRTDEALDGYRQALAYHADDQALVASAIAVARDIKANEALLDWSDMAVARFPANNMFRIFRADALGHIGDAAAALAILEPLAQDDSNAAVQAAHWSLTLLDAETAAKHAERATQLAPGQQAGWAYLSTAWRFTNDQRLGWLIDYDRMTTSLKIDAPQGYSSLAAFLDELRATLEAMHLTRTHPADQSLREGTQTRGHLFTRRNPHITALGLCLRDHVEDWLSRLPADSSHPFLARNTGKIAYRHSWSVRLRDSGFHVNHIHQDGWLSSAFYVALPPAVGSDGTDGQPQGALTLGQPDASLGLALPPEGIIEPEPGMLALFPSYVWHGTVPFSSNEPRLTVAFDAQPR